MGSSHSPHHSDSSFWPLSTLCLQAPYVNTLILDKLLQWDVQRWPPAPSSVRLAAAEAPSVGHFWCNTPDDLKCMTAAWPHSSSTTPPLHRSAAHSHPIITQLHAPRLHAADWFISDNWQQKLSEGIKYSHSPWNDQQRKSESITSSTKTSTLTFGAKISENICTGHLIWVNHPICWFRIKNPRFRILLSYFFKVFHHFIVHIEHTTKKG